MKIIPLHKDEKKLIKKAIKSHRDAQKYIYDKYSPKMLSVCRQYIKDIHYAEDVMLSGFFKVFKNLKQYNFSGSFEGWIRRIMVNEAISFLRKKQLSVFLDEVSESKLFVYDKEYQSDFDVEQIQQLIDRLPKGYKMVFILFAIEGYKHKEIAQILKISESTSKSQYFKSKKMLQKLMSNIKERENVRNEV